MKSSRTKMHELVSDLFGVGRFVVKDSDIQNLLDHFDKALSEFLPEEYKDVLLEYLEGGSLTPATSQKKFHLMKILRSLAQKLPNLCPIFLEEVTYPKDKMWSVADLGLVFFGLEGDPKIYQKDLPKPENGEAYTTEEVTSLINST